MLLSEWWVANPTDGTEDYQPPDSSERVPGALSEVDHGQYMLETIGFLDDQPFTVSGSGLQSFPSRLEIWGTDRDGTCYSLFDSLRANSASKTPHASGGHEDWIIGWLARGRAWVTPDSECSSARIHIDDLPTWALYGQSDCFEFNPEQNTATIDLSDEILGATVIGGTHVSLTRSSHSSWNYPGQDAAQQIEVASVAYWKVEGPLTLHTVINEWIEPFECLLRFMTMKPSVITSINCHVGDWNSQPLDVELIAPRLQRDERATSGVTSKPVEYLTTLQVLQAHSIDPMEVLIGYWNKTVTGDVHMALLLHLESQDRLVSRGVDGALLNAVRSIESLYTAQTPEYRSSVFLYRRRSTMPYPALLASGHSSLMLGQNCPGSGN